METFIRKLEGELKDNKNDILEIQKMVTAVYPEKKEIFERDLMDAWSSSHMRPIYFVARRNGIIRGIIGLAPALAHPSVHQIFWVVVDVSKQRQGLGTEMMHHVISKIRELDGSLVIVATACPEYFKRFNFKTFKIIKEESGKRHHMFLAIK
jgi:N-acetylglutamate synthase-like GNAT family acetyltransferase